MKRGDIWWADLPASRGSERGFRRPVVIVSEDRFNDSALQTVIVVALTTNLRLGGLPGNVAVPARGTGLTTASVANVTQLATVNRDDLDVRIGRVSSSVMDGISDGLRLVLAL
jgi:mRNA interferase MazF